MTSRLPKLGLAAPALALAVAAATLAASVARPGPEDPSPDRWRQHDVRRPKPPVLAPPEGASIAAKPPEGAVVLFDGSNLDAWQAGDGGPARWKVADGVMQTVPGAGAIQTKRAFGDIQLHVEWATPAPPVGRSQDRGNSGVFLMGDFEIQVLDSYQSETYADGQAGAIYGQYPPLFNASRPPGEWQTYDIAFRRPRFGADGALAEPARITVFQNGVLVQNNEEPFGPTSWLKWLPYSEHGGEGPISLQDHDHPVRYRNLWLVELPERAAPTAEARARPEAVSLDAATLDRYAGRYALGPGRGSARATVAREGDHLTLSLPFRPTPLDLVPTSETEFDMPSTDGGFTFRLDDSGRVTGAEFRVGDGRRTMPRVEP
jgi:hypothetical protein